MKHLAILFYLTCATVFNNTHAQKTLNLDTGCWDSTATAPTVTKTIVPTTKGYEVTYKFHKALVMPDELIPETDVWYLEGFSVNNVPTEPAYPYACDSFSIPSGYSASVNILTEDWYTVESNIASGRAPQLLSDTTKITANNNLPLKIKQGWFPTFTTANRGINAYKDIDILNIDVIPMQFDTSLGKARICKTLKYEVVFNESTAIPNDSASSPLLNGVIETEYTEYEDDAYLSMTTLNWDLEHKKSDGSMKAATGVTALSAYSSTPYLIITTSSYKNSVTEFADWKRTLGFNVIVATAPSWTPQSIKNEITRVKNLYPKLSYLLIVGNNAQVPAESVTIEGMYFPVLTDLQYALTAKRKVDSSYDFIPDIKYGRIPVNNETEAKTVFSKIIDYEKNAPSSDNSFYTTPLFLSTFLDNDKIKDGEADMRNCQTSYEIANQLKKLGLEPIVEFLAKTNKNPLRWSDPAIINNNDGTPSIALHPEIPLQLRKPLYNWDVTVPRIQEHLNNGSSQLYYFAHGEKSGWIDMLNVSNISGLQNGNKLPVAFSMACSTGDFTQPGCFAEKMLTLPGGGVAAIYAFTNLTYAAYTDVIAASFYKGMYPEMSYKPLINWEETVVQPDFDNNNTITELGTLDCLAKTNAAKNFPDNYLNNKYKKYEISLLTLFGDPSMNIYLTKPKAVKADVTIIDNKLHVTTDTDAIVTVFNRQSGEVSNWKGSVIGVELPSDYSSLTLCIHKPGTLPYVKDMLKISKKRSITADNKLVREDRIWTYYQAWNANMNPPEDILMKVKFSGTTEINGKVYYNCYAWKAENEFSATDCPIIAYMREEENKAYAYYPAITDFSIAKDVYEKFHIDILPCCPPLKSEFLNYSCERMIFDFNLNAGDVMWLNKDEMDLENARLTVEDVSAMECEGQEFLTQQYSGILEGYSAIEEVGATTGLLPFPGELTLSYGYDHFCLVEMTDINLSTIFKNPSFSSIHALGTDSNIIETQYYDLQGRRIANPSSGVFIRTDIFDNGNRQITKIIM